MKKAQAAFTKLDPKEPAHAEILEMFGAKKFIPSKAENYKDIEKIGRELGLVK